MPHQRLVLAQNRWIAERDSSPSTQFEWRKSRESWLMLISGLERHLARTVQLPGLPYGHSSNNDRRLAADHRPQLYGALNQTTDATFATTANQLAAGTSLYRFSTEHGGLQCAACHGATHAELPSAQANDDLQAMDLTGTVCPIRECTVCHQSGISSTNGGPHGMHDVGAGWVSTHSRVVGRNAAACQPCHGTITKVLHCPIRAAIASLRRAADWDASARAPRPRQLRGL